MVIVSLMGGLGNQLFQYAFGLRLAADWQTDVRLNQFMLSSRWLAMVKGYTPRAFALDAFGVEKPSASPVDVVRAMLPLPTGTVLLREGSTTHPARLPITPPAKQVVCMGYWQSEDYFKTAESAVRQRLQFQQTPSSLTQQLADTIQRTDRSVFLHVRRGDYLTNTNANKYHGVCGETYYQRAILYLRERIADARFFVFSDDLSWVQQRLCSELGSATYVAGNVGADSWQDMYLMSLCRHAIVANSSFSWWGAWLNAQTNRIVVAPQHWFAADKSDYPAIVPPHWIRL